jgi:hypothetical protein
MNFLLGKLAPYKLLIEIVLIGSLVAGALYAYNRFCEGLREEGRAEVRAEDARLAAVKEAADRRVEQAWSKQAEKAEQNATKQSNRSARWPRWINGRRNILRLSAGMCQRKSKGSLHGGQRNHYEYGP